MTLHRVTNLKLKKNGDEHEKVQLRNKWVARVEANTVGMQLAPGDTPERQSVLDWCKKFRMSQEELEQAIANPAWRANLIRELNYLPKMQASQAQNKQNQTGRLFTERVISLACYHQQHLNTPMCSRCSGEKQHSSKVPKGVCW